jgi:twitching motility protein PilT
MAYSQLDALLGKLLLHRQLLDQTQLDRAVRAQQASPQMTLADALVASGLFSPDDLGPHLEAARQLAERRAPQPPKPAARPAPAAAAPPPAPVGSPTGAPAPRPGLAVAPASKPQPQPQPAPDKPAAGPPGRNPTGAMKAVAGPAGEAPGRGRGGITFLPVVEMVKEEAPSASELSLEEIKIAEEPPKPSSPFDAPSGTPPLEEIHLVMKVATDMRASDLHLHAGRPVLLRLRGELEEQPTATLSVERLQQMILAILTEQQQAVLQENGELDLAYTVPGVGRFRGNVYRHQGGMDATFRIIPAQVPTLQALGLPDKLGQVTNYHNGLILFTGPAGCGKSTTMASVINLINLRRDAHILTIEDPIEYLFRPARASINQRQVGAHTESFQRALRGALREDPDVLVIGELRDFESIFLALTAAETGHLVLGTLHTSSAVRTVNRLIGAFPPNEQDQARAMVAATLRAVVSQRLIRTANKQRRVPALELMMANTAVVNMIRDNKTPQIRTILQTSNAEGMYLLDNSLMQLAKSGTITREEAIRHMEEPQRMGG